MPRKIELDNGKLQLTETEVDGFLERTVTPLGTSGKADVPKRFIGRRSYVIILKK